MLRCFWKVYCKIQIFPECCCPFNYVVEIYGDITTTRLFSIKSRVHSILTITTV